MSGIGTQGAATIYNIGGGQNTRNSSFSLSTPAGWAMLWWGLAIVIILLMFWSL